MSRSHFSHLMLMLGTLIISLVILVPLLQHLTSGASQWQLLQKSIGISAMHMQLLSNDRVIMFDRTDFGRSNLPLPAGKCRKNDQIVGIDCTAHSAEYNTISNTVRPLMVQTDTWCSSGSVLPNGQLAQTGGFNEGQRVVRTFTPCPTCDWVELPNKLLAPRWYASDHSLPDGQVIVVGGRGNFNYEFYPKTPNTSKLFDLPFLAETNDPGVENNLYPYVFLNVDGNLFIFANNRAILFNYKTGVVVKTYPTIPGGDPRSYPSTGSAVLLPIKNLEKPEPEVLVCGGTPRKSFEMANKGRFLRALNTCARLKLTDQNPTWIMEKMPMARTMSDMILLPNEAVLIINGAQSGVAGWDMGRHPVLKPLIYHPDKALGSRFEVQEATKTPRMYHSTAALIRDGRVLVAGSNPHEFYNFTKVLFPTELSLQAFLPKYLNVARSGPRPVIITPNSTTIIKYKRTLTIKFSFTGLILFPSLVKVTMIRPPFSTHSFSMNQRMLVLTNSSPVTSLGNSTFHVTVRGPPSRIIAPPGFYMLFLVHRNVPSEGIWVQLM